MSFLKSLASALRLVAGTDRFDSLFRMSDADLARRGYDRDRLVRGYLWELGAL